MVQQREIENKVIIFLFIRTFVLLFTITYYDKIHIRMESFCMYGTERMLEGRH